MSVATERVQHFVILARYTAAKLSLFHFEMKTKYNVFNSEFSDWRKSDTGAYLQ